MRNFEQYYNDETGTLIHRDQPPQKERGAQEDQGREIDKRAGDELLEIIE